MIKLLRNMLLCRTLRPPGSCKGFGMATLRDFVTRNADARKVLGPHWNQILNPVDKMSIAEVKALMDEKLIKLLLESTDTGEHMVKMLFYRCLEDLHS